MSWKSKISFHVKDVQAILLVKHHIDIMGYTIEDLVAAEIIPAKPTELPVYHATVKDICPKRYTCELESQQCSDAQMYV